MTSLASHLWAIRPSYDLRATFAFRDAAATAARPIEFTSVAVDDILKVQGGEAYIFIAGPIFPGAWRCEGTDTDVLHAAVRKAVADRAVTSITLVIASPGGAISGIPPIVGLLRDAPKPVRADIRSECCSAAYWLAAQAKAGIVAARGALIGCLGVYQVLVDVSKGLAAQGTEVRVYASDPIKGLGVCGAPISEEQDAFMREHIAECADLFWRDIHAVRPKVPRSAFTGAYHFPEKAFNLGLIDDFAL